MSETTGFLQSTVIIPEWPLVHHHYIGFLPSREEMKAIGWEFDPLGPSAEGPTYKRKVDGVTYRLQIVQQGPGSQSVINENRKIKGYQNCQICGNNRDWFGYVYNMEDIANACVEIGIQ